MWHPSLMNTYSVGRIIMYRYVIIWVLQLLDISSYVSFHMKHLWSFVSYETRGHSFHMKHSWSFVSYETLVVIRFIWNTRGHSFHMKHSWSFFAEGPIHNFIWKDHSCNILYYVITWGFASYEDIVVLNIAIYWFIIWPSSYSVK